MSGRKTICVCVSVLLLFALLGANVCALSEGESSPASAEESCRSHVYFCTAPYGPAPAEVSVLVSTERPVRADMGEKDIAAEIVYYPFDSEAGLYAVNGEPADSRAEIVEVSEDRSAYTVRLTQPGKYMLSGAPFYAFDPAVTALKELRAELEEAVEAGIADTEKATAEKLHDWLCSRVSPVIPEEKAGQAAAFADPVNALLSGYAVRETYASLYWLLLRAADIRSLVVSGTAEEESATWNLCRLDGRWSWTDAALDDVKDRKQKKYLQLDDAKIAKDHALSAEDESYVQHMICPAVFDCQVEGTLPFKVKEPPVNSDRRVEHVYFDGPAFIVGNSATITWHDVSNYAVISPGTDPALQAAVNFCYSAWLAEDRYYCPSDPYAAPEREKAPKVGDVSELLTVDSVAEDMSSFTVTFHKPGLYSFYNGTNFWLIGPEETELVALAEQINKAVEAAKSPTETETAKKLLKWLNGKLSYDYSFGDSPRGIIANYEPMTALLYGKCVCGGYANTYNMLLQQAGILSFGQSGNTKAGGHSWNLHRLDGTWSHTDPTWSDPGTKYFNLTEEQIKKDHDPFQLWALEHFFFGDPFSLQADQFDAEYKPADYVPRALKTLPLSVEEYGFPEKDPGFFRIIKTSKDTKTNSFVFELNKKAYHCSAVAMSGLEQESGSFRYGADNASTFKCPYTKQRLKLRAASYDIWSPLKKASLYTEAYYDAGTVSDVSCRYLVPMKKNEIRGYSEKSYRVWAHDENLQPVWAGWHLENDAVTCEISVYFSADGRAERYSVIYTPAEGEKKSWEATVDGTLLKLNGRKTDDSSAADAGAWEQIRFE